MATKQSDEMLVQVATRVPQALLEAVRLWCAQHDESVMTFVEDAVRDKLRRTRVRQV